MIISVIAIQVTTNIVLSNKIVEMPSPATIFYASSSGGLENYSALLTETRAVTDWYGKLSSEEKNRCIVDWYRAAQKKNDQLTKEFADKSTSLTSHLTKRHKYEKGEYDKGDFAKVDVLLMLDNKPTIFNRPEKLRKWYGVSGDTGFNTETPTLQSYRRLVSQAGGLPWEGCYSFERPYKESQERFVEWIKTLK